jgi:hypothetical protein
MATRHALECVISYRIKLHHPAGRPRAATESVLAVLRPSHPTETPRSLTLWHSTYNPNLQRPLPRNTDCSTHLGLQVLQRAVSPQSACQSVLFHAQAQAGHAPQQGRCWPDLASALHASKYQHTYILAKHPAPPRLGKTPLTPLKPGPLKHRLQLTWVCRHSSQLLLHEARAGVVFRRRQTVGRDRLRIGLQVHTSVQDHRHAELWVKLNSTCSDTAQQCACAKLMGAQPATQGQLVRWVVAAQPQADHGTPQALHCSRGTHRCAGSHAHRALGRTQQYLKIDGEQVITSRGVGWVIA